MKSRRYSLSSLLIWRTCLISFALFAASADPSKAQGKTWRIGFLTPGAAEAGIPAASIRNTVLRILSERGFSEGKNLVYYPAAADGDVSRLPELAKWISEQRPDAIIVVGTLAAALAMKESPDTPIVLSFAGEDPVKLGLAASLARPGGTVTGIFFRAIETEAKRLELLSEALPSTRAFGFLAAPTLEAERSELLALTAAKLGVSLATRVVEKPEDYAAAFETFRAEGITSVLVMASTIFAPHAGELSRRAAERGISTFCEWDHMARAGCTFAFGPSLVALRQLTGDYVARILNGAKPADLPIQQPDRFTFSLNLKSVEQLKLTIPSAYLARADEVIE